MRGRTNVRSGRRWRPERLLAAVCTAGIVVAGVSPTGSAAREVPKDRLAPPLWNGAEYLASVGTSEQHARGVVLPATVAPSANAALHEASYPTLTPAGRPAAPTRWRVISGTGNCCENYLASTRSGMLLDFGGDFLNYSTDQGRSWSEVFPADTSFIGETSEGAVAVAPGGDVVGVAWFPYRGDLVMPFKYDAASDEWSYTTMKLHQRFFDRPSVAVIPGPFTFGISEVDYISVLRGGSEGIKSPWFFSFDGLNYFVPNSRLFDETTTQPIRGRLLVEPWDELDWLQPHEQIAITPLGRRRALAGRPTFGSIEDAAHLTAQFSMFEADTMRWREFEFAGDALPRYGRLLADSRGRLHYVSAASPAHIDYLVSSDGGRSWESTGIDLPAGFKLPESAAYQAHYYTAFQVNGGLGVAALAVHAQHAETLDTQDYVYKFDVRGAMPKLAKIYLVGAGDDNATSDRDASPEVFDFPSLALLPGGRIAVSFTDAAHKDPAVAVELGRGKGSSDGPLRSLIKSYGGALPAGNCFSSGIPGGVVSPVDVGCPWFGLKPVEDRLVIHVDDDSGDAVAAVLYEATDDGFADTEFCSDRKDPFVLDETTHGVYVQITDESCESGGSTSLRRGTVRVLTYAAP